MNDEEVRGEERIKKQEARRKREVSLYSIMATYLGTPYTYMYICM